MRTGGRVLGLAGALPVLLVVSSGRAAAQEPPAPAVRAIPGITAPDPFPQACVSCHVVLPDGMDARLSTLVKGWTAGTDSVLLAKAQAAAPAGMKLTGRHPDVSRVVGDIPAGCLACHGQTATMAPSFARMLHRIHLVGGDANHFITMFGGECTLCHKLDPVTGAWSIPSGKEP